MRLNRLDLTRYGRFTDRRIDFGTAEAGKPDLHVIHGPNEAGKSTLFSAWLDFLYGIDARSSYNFLHDYKTMRIGATIETASGIRSLVRVKKQASSLLDISEQPVGDAVLMGDLGGLDRDAYKTMFSLDETSLELGGEAILASKGDVGQMLFSASSGLSDLAQRLDRIREESEQFHRPRAQKTELADLKHRLDDLKAQKDAIDIAASEHARLVVERDRARAAHDEANRRRAGLRVKLENAASRLAALPYVNRLDGLRQELAAMDAPPAAPAGWVEDIAALRRRDVELATALDRLARDIAVLVKAIATLPERDPVLDRAADLEAMHEPAGRALSEARDLPNRVAERLASDRNLASILQRLGRMDASEPMRLLLPARVLGALKGLIADHSGIRERLETARREVVAAGQALETHRLKLDGDREATRAAPDPAARERLSGALSAIRAVDLSDRLARSRQAEAASLAILDRRLQQLQPWKGNHQALGEIVIPAAAVIADLGRRISEAVSLTVRMRTEHDGIAAELAGIQAERLVVATAPGLATDEDVRQARDARDFAWGQHRQQLDAASADRFMQTMQADDRIGEQRLAHMSDIVRIRGLDQSIARLSARKALAEQAFFGAVAGEQGLHAECTRLIASVSPDLPADMTLVTFQAWCAAFGAAREALEAFERVAEDRRVVEAAIAETTRRLSAALAGTGLMSEDSNLDHMVVLAQHFLEGETRREVLYAGLQGLEADLVRRRADIARAEADRAAWDTSWASALAGTWLSERGEMPSVMEMAEILDMLQHLATELTHRDSLVDRIAKMERDIAGFAESVSAFARGLGIPPDVDVDAHRLHRLLIDRLATARKVENSLRQDDIRLAQLDAERQQLLGEQAELGARIGTMAAHLAVTTLDEVEQRLGLLARRQALESEISSLGRQITDSLGVGDLSGVEEDLAGVDRQALAADIEVLKPEAEALDDETKRAYAAFSAAEERLAALRGDGEAARLAEMRRTVLLEIEDGAKRYLELRLGAMATDQALRLYRDRHQSSMMQKASDAFRELSRGNYRGLTAQRDGQREILIALGADGSSKEAGDMSKGTQFQLYLALRVAGYQEYAVARPPVPFIADDIMESFDEDRSAEALTQLAHMAGSGQVIYLTHHQHICDIARSICPTVTVHNL